MAKKDLFSLFEERFRRPGELVASPPESLETIALHEEDQELVLRRIKKFEDVRPKVDYSDFENFVFFNSALDYFNVVGEKILNEYPRDGTVEEIEAFVDELDDYQRHAVDVWPKRIGHLRFAPASGFASVEVQDAGVAAGVAKTAFLSPGTGSWSLEFWCVPPPVLTGSSDVMVVAQKTTGSADGYSVYFSGSRLHFRFSSGSVTNEVSASFSAGSNTYFACVFDRGADLSIVYTGSAGAFPRIAASAALGIAGPVDLGSTAFYVGSGSLASKVVRPLTGALDDLRVWNVARSIGDLSGSYNSRIHAQDGLMGLWRFNESGSSPSAAQNALMLDHSGHRLDGRTRSYFAALRASGSLIPFDSPDLILFYDAKEVETHVAEQQTSGSAYDRDNDNKITRLVPEQFFLLEDERGTRVLENFLYVLAREFDSLKTKIDQFVNVFRSNYGEHDQAPDALLAEAGRFFGWEFVGSFLNADAFQYITGRGVLPNMETNRELETKLFEIKNEFWKRTLVNLMHIYKTKGTRESVEALMRIYGVEKGFARLKEYGSLPNAGIATHRVLTEKSVPALSFGSGTLTGSTFVVSPAFSSSLRSIEARLRFPTDASSGMTATATTGTIWTINSASGGIIYQLFYTKNSTTAKTGSFFLTGAHGSLQLTGAAVFDDDWCNVAATVDAASSSLSLDVRRIERGEVVLSTRASAAVVPLTSSRNVHLWLGSTGSVVSQMWMQEARVWDRPLTAVELDDHALDFQSYGTEEFVGSDDLELHWRLNEDETATTDESFALTFPFEFAIEEVFDVQDVSTNGRTGFAFGYPVGVNPYKRFLNEYSFIAPPDYGWNEEKIRVVPSSRLPPGDTFVENRDVALEFNMVDALNEDISQIVATLDEMNEAIGLPANRYRGTYQKLDKLRSTYFKRLQGRLNFNLFADMLEFFDRSFVAMVRRLLPARANFLGEELVVESHMLERSKLQWNYRRQDRPLELEGVVKVYLRD